MGMHFHGKGSGGLKYSDSPNIDSFSRLRVSLPHTLFDAGMYTGISALAFSTSTASSATVTHDTNKKAAILTSHTTTNSEAILQTRQYMKYLPGKSQLVIITGNVNGAATNNRKRWGQFDANNGFFFELSGSTLSANKRSKITGSVVDTSITQANWNLDKMDGTGPSGYTLDLNKQNIWIISYQWLGSGRILFGLDIDGKICYVHQILNANVLSTMYSQSATLPLRYEIKNTGSTSSTMEITCMSIVSEGGEKPIGIPYAVRTAKAGRSIAGTADNYPVISLRKRSTFIEVPISILQMSSLLAASDQVQVDVVLNATLTGASWVNSGTVTEYDISATSFTGGTVIHTGYMLGSNSGGQLDLSGLFDSTNLATLGCDLAGTSDILTLSVSNITSGTTVSACINFKELIN